MNINDRFQSLQHILGNEAVSPAGRKGAKVSTLSREKVGLAADEAHVSSAASLATQAAAASDVRMEKVTAIQQALAAGTYKVSNSEVAASLIDSMLQR
ncbi:MAG TPA: flagellar biosynthesis anti-sigma factor FlgM [Acidisarcina sp.]|nr:flagellar biosynthesis anti-sigma factor FlgM [Acidisarcina sp.]